jgi:hypothetical protein
MFNPIIIIAIIIQGVVARSSRKAGAILGFVITLGILLWGISIYGDGDQIAFFGIPLSEPIFYLACLVWFGFDTMEFVAAQKKAAETGALPTTGTSPTTITKTQIPGVALFFLWIATNVFANIGWSMLRPLFGPTSSPITIIVLNLSSGLIAGVLQWLLLMLIIPNAQRRHLALWIPATMVGWAIISIIVAFVTLPSGIGTTIFVAIIRGGTMGVLQWLVLQKYSKIALWWIPANIFDILAVTFLPRFIFETFTIRNMMIGNTVIAVLASIVTSIAIVFISKQVHPSPDSETAPVIESI